MKKLFFSVFAISVIFSACKKDDKTCDLTTANLAASYKITSIKYKASSSVPETEVLSLWLDACQRDDITTFNTNGTVNFQDAGTVCSPSGNGTGVWSLSGSTLTVDGEAASVSSFSCSAMTITFTDNTTGEVIKTTFTKQ